MSVKHAHQTAIPNDPTKDVSATHWNADHDVTLAEADITTAHSTIDHASLTSVLSPTEHGLVNHTGITGVPAAEAFTSAAHASTDHAALASVLSPAEHDALSHATVTGGLVWVSGTADPSAGGGVAATVPAVYVRTNGGGTELWVKTGAGDTAWNEILTLP